MLTPHRAGALGALVLACAVAPARAQGTAAARDTVADSTRSRRLSTVTIATTPADRDAPATTRRLDAATLRLTPSTGPYDLLRQAAGLEVHLQGQGPGFASNISMRGFSSDHGTDLALWVDGVPINLPVSGHAEGYNDWTVLFPAAIQDLDVTRGPSNELFGNFALAGSVNVRTLERTRGTQLDVSGGNFGTGDVSLLTGFDRGASGGGVFGVRVAHEDGFRPNGDNDAGQVHARLLQALSARSMLDVGFEATAGRWHSSGFLGEGEFVADSTGIVSNRSDGGDKLRLQERVSLRTVLGAGIWRTTLYSTQSDWRLFLTIPPDGGQFEGTGSQTEEHDRRIGVGLTSALSARWGAADVTVGIESRWDRANYQNWFTTNRARDSVQADVRARQALVAVFAGVQVPLADDVRLDVGLRADEFLTNLRDPGGVVTDGQFGVVSPKVGLAWTLTRALQLYGNVSRGFRATDGIVSDATLGPISAWSYETGARWSGHGTELAAVLFLTDVSNEQTFNPATLTSTSGGSSRRKGLELEWRAPVTGWAQLGGSWTFLDARYDHLAIAPKGGGPPDVLDGQHVYNTAEYVGAAHVEVAPPGAAWRVQLGGNWVGPYSPFDAPGRQLGAYGLAHAAVRFPLAGVEWTAQVRNLFDRRYPELMAGTVVSPGQPRSVALSARVLF